MPEQQAAEAASPAFDLALDIQHWIDRIGSLSPTELATRFGISLALVALLWLARRLVVRLVTGFVERRVAGSGDDPHQRDLVLRLAQLESSVRKLVMLVAISAGLLGLAEIWALLPSAGTLDTTVLLETLGSVLLVLALALIAWRLVPVVVSFLLLPRTVTGTLTVSPRARTLIPLLSGVGRTIVGVLAVLLLLAELGLNITPLLASAGIAGLAIGFGAQSLVKDFLTGLMIVIEDSMGVGDVVQVAGHAGHVEHMGVRCVRLRDQAGVQHVVPYSAIDVVENMTKDFAYAVFDVGVSYKASIDAVVTTLRDIAADLAADEQYRGRLLEPIDILGLDRFDESAVVIRARIKTLPTERWAVQREFNRRLKLAFDARGIEIPFPHRTLVFGDVPPPLLTGKPPVSREPDLDDEPSGTREDDDDDATS